MSKKRADRRQAERDAVKLARARMKLAAAAPGGAPDRPIEVTSASTVEVHATGLPCPACELAGTRLEEHAAVSEGTPPRHLRVARLRCPRCGVRREVYFRIGTALPS